MGLYEEFKEEIDSTLLNQESQKVNWDKFLNDMKTIIIRKYNGEDHNKYRGLWKHAFKQASKRLNLDCSGISRCDNWNIIQDELPLIVTPTQSTTSKSNTSSLNYQKKLDDNDLSRIRAIHDKITRKWKLNSEKNVEDIMYNASMDFSYQHPAHSYILDIKDPIWISHFSVEDLSEINEQLDHSLTKDFPPTLEKMVMKLNNKTTFREIYNEFNTVIADPVDNREEYWLKNSIINYIMLFIDGNNIPPIKSEQDLLDDIYGFIKTSKRLSRTNTETGTESLASSEVQNQQRAISSISKIDRKSAADHADLVFKHLSHELGCVEIGLADKGPNGTKELHERAVKSPTMLKSFVCQISDQYKIAPDDVKVVAIIISGMSISAQVMTCSKGSVSLLSTSLRYHMPESIEEIARLLPPVLKMIYNCSQIVKNTAVHLKKVSSTVEINSNKNVYFPPCFIATANNKRNYKVAFNED